VTVGVSSEAKQLNSWRVSDYTPEYRQTSQKVLQVEKYDYTLHPDAQKLIPRKASEHIPEWRKGACSEEYTYTPTIPASHPKKTASYGKQKKKKAEPHFDQQSVYQEPGYHDFPDDFSADNYSDHTDMVPLDKDSIMS
jgi:type IV secretion system protein VirD4